MRSLCVLVLTKMSARKNLLAALIMLDICVILLIVVSVVVSSSAVDCVERLVSKTSCYVSSVMLNSAHLSLAANVP